MEIPRVWYYPRNISSIKFTQHQRLFQEKSFFNVKHFFKHQSFLYFFLSHTIIIAIWNDKNNLLWPFIYINCSEVLKNSVCFNLEIVIALIWNNLLNVNVKGFLFFLQRAPSNSACVHSASLQMKYWGAVTEKYTKLPEKQFSEGRA